MQDSDLEAVFHGFVLVIMVGVKEQYRYNIEQKFWLEIVTTSDQCCGSTVHRHSDVSGAFAFTMTISKILSINVAVHTGPMTYVVVVVVCVFDWSLHYQELLQRL